MPFITLISKIALQNLAKSHELQDTHAVSHEPRKLQTKNQKDTKFSVFYRYLSLSFPHASARHLLAVRHLVYIASYRSSYAVDLLG